MNAVRRRFRPYDYELPAGVRVHPSRPSSWGSKILDVAAAAICLIMIAPLLWMLVSSLKSNQEIFSSPFTLPSQLLFSNYATAWSEGLGRSMVNSAIVVGVSLPVVLGLACTASYALARYPFRGRSLIIWFFLSSLMIPVLLGLIPLFILLQKLGLLGTYQGLILVYVAFQLPFTIYLMLPFFRALPKELEEAAAIDGHTTWQTFRAVILPLSWPVIGAAAIFGFIALWTEYLLALVFLSDPDKHTATVEIAATMFRQRSMAQYGPIFAALVLATIPTLAVLFTFERRMVKTIRFGGLKE